MTVLRLTLKNKISGFKNNNISNFSNQLPINQSAVTDKNVNKIKLKIPAKSKLLELEQQVKILENSLQNAREEAFSSGVEEGREQVKKETNEKIQLHAEKFTQTIESLKHHFEKTLKNMDKPLITLSKRFAEKIIQRELKNIEDYNELLLIQIKKLIIELIDQNTITIQVSPQQIEWIQNTNIHERLNIPKSTNVKLIENHSVKLGECIFETDEILVESIISKQLNNLEKQLLNT